MCKHEGKLTKCVGSKLTINCNDDGKRTIKFTQPVIIKKLNEEYEISDGPESKMPAVTGQVLVYGQLCADVDPTKLTHPP